MKLKVGDLVRFLNEKGEGTVSKLINKTTVAVCIADGFEIPYLIAELVLVHAAAGIETEENSDFGEEEPSDFKRPIINTKQEDKGIYIAFAPEHSNDLANSDINVWLVNYTDYKILFSYSILRNQQFETLETDAADAFETLLIETIDRKLLHDFSNFKMDVIFYNAKLHLHQAPLSELIKLKPIKLYKENAFIKNAFIPEKALLMCVSLLETSLEEKRMPKVDLEKVLFQKKAKSNSSKISKPHLQNNPASEVEIDLHIEELIDNFSGMSNYEIVQVQLKHFKNALDAAINDRCRKLVVIHGVGNGRLKQEVRDILAKEKNLRFYDASYAKYGFGATEILIH